MQEHNGELPGVNGFLKKLHAYAPFPPDSTIDQLAGPFGKPQPTVGQINQQSEYEKRLVAKAAMAFVKPYSEIQADWQRTNYNKIIPGENLPVLDADTSAVQESEIDLILKALNVLALHTNNKAETYACADLCAKIAEAGLFIRPTFGN